MQDLSVAAAAAFFAVFSIAPTWAQEPVGQISGCINRGGVIKSVAPGKEPSRPCLQSEQPFTVGGITTQTFSADLSKDPAPSRATDWKLLFETDEVEFVGRCFVESVVHIEITATAKNGQLMNPAIWDAGTDISKHEVGISVRPFQIVSSIRGILEISDLLEPEGTPQPPFFFPFPILSDTNTAYLIRLTKAAGRFGTGDSGIGFDCVVEGILTAIDLS